MAHSVCAPGRSGFPLTRRLTGIATLVCGVLGLAASRSSLAQHGYPVYTDTRVNDFAQVLGPDEIGQLRARLDEFKQRRHVEVVVVTIQSIRDYPVGAPNFETFATGLFNTWGVGDRTRNDGAMLLVAVRDRKVRVELGSGYGRLHDARMAELIQNRIIPHFRRNDYRAGILEGARGVLETLNPASGAPAISAAAAPASEAAQQTPAQSSQTAAPMLEAPIAAQGQARPVPPPSPPSRNYPPPPVHVAVHRQGSGASALLVLVASGLAVVAVGVGLSLRNRPRLCPHCKQHMTHLDELSDDVYLDSGAKLEEKLNSVNYDVWKCPACQMHTIERNSRWFSGYGHCPSCNYKTLSESTETLEQATYHSTGRQLVRKSCSQCNYHDEDTIVLPMLRRAENHALHAGSRLSHSGRHASGSRSSGRGSFGGGSSSGGGASGSW